MEASTKRRLHPLIAIAAVSVTVFSLVGIGALTGLIPTGHSESAPVQSAANEPAQSVVAALPPKPAATTTTAQEAKPAEKHIARKKTVKQPKAAEKASEPADKAATAAPAEVVKDTAPVTIAQNSAPATMTPPPAPNQPAPAIAPPKPVCHDCGVIESVREVEKPGAANGAGAAIGGIAGGLLGHQTGKGTGRDVMTVLGAIGGALAGNEIEKNTKKVKSYEIDIRFDDGTSRLITQNTPPAWRMGDRVKLVNGVITAG